MNALITTAVTMTSREIAELVDSRHDKVRQSIERLAARAVIESPPMGNFKNSNNVTGSEYIFSGEKGKRDSIIVVAQLCPEFTARLVDRWQELESQLAEPVALPSYAETLRLYADQIEETQRVTAERDSAIATKALIGSKREATAMARASAAAREVQRLKGELGCNSKHATVMAVARVTGKDFPVNAYVPLRRWCKLNNAAPVDVVDARFGTVKSWPAAAWLEAYGICLEKIFPLGGEA